MLPLSILPTPTTQWERDKALYYSPVSSGMTMGASKFHHHLRAVSMRPCMHACMHARARARVCVCVCVIVHVCAYVCVSRHVCLGVYSLWLLSQSSSVLPTCLLAPSPHQLASPKSLLSFLKAPTQA